MYKCLDLEDQVKLNDYFADSRTLRKDVWQQSYYRPLANNYVRRYLHAGCKTIEYCWFVLIINQLNRHWESISAWRSAACWSLLSSASTDIFTIPFKYPYSPKQGRNSHFWAFIFNESQLTVGKKHLRLQGTTSRDNAHHLGTTTDHTTGPTERLNTSPDCCAFKVRLRSCSWRAISWAQRQNLSRIYAHLPCSLPLGGSKLLICFRNLGLKTLQLINGIQVIELRNPPSFINGP